MLVTDNAYPRIYTRHSQSTGLVYVALRADQRPVCIDYGRQTLGLPTTAWWSNSYRTEADLQRLANLPCRGGRKHAELWLQGLRRVED